MRSTTACVALFGLLLLPACGTDDAEMEEGTDAMEEMAEAAPTEAELLAPYAGMWTTHVYDEAGDSLTTMTMTATDSREGWTAQFVGRDDVIPIRVLEVTADGVTTEMGPYPSALRDGVEVTTTVDQRMEGDQVMGTFRAVYAGAGEDSVLVGTLRSTRMQM